MATGVAEAVFVPELEEAVQTASQVRNRCENAAISTQTTSNATSSSHAMVTETVAQHLDSSPKTAVQQPTELGGSVTDRQ